MNETQTPLEAQLERWADAHEDLPECAYGAELARQATDELTQLREEVARLGREKRLAFLDGVERGYSEFAWWASGEQMVGTCGTTLKKAMEWVDAARACALAPHAGGGDG
jgi:exonuclease VII small subunit